MCVWYVRDVCVCSQYKASKEGTVMGVAVSKISMLTHCQALTQACNYCEGECYTATVEQMHWSIGTATAQHWAAPELSEIN